MDRFICQTHVARVAVGIRIHRHGGDAQPAAGGDDAAGDFAAVGDQHLVEIRLAFASDGGVLGHVVLGHGKALCTPPWWRVEGRRRNNRCGRSLPITAHSKAASLHCVALRCIALHCIALHCAGTALWCVRTWRAAAPQPKTLLRVSTRIVSFRRAGTPHLHHIRNTPKRVASIGAFKAADNPRPSTRRVSAGSMMPSSHRRALA